MACGSDRYRGRAPDEAARNKRAWRLSRPGFPSGIVVEVADCGTAARVSGSVWCVGALVWHDNHAGRCARGRVVRVRRVPLRSPRADEEGGGADAERGGERVERSMMAYTPSRCSLCRSHFRLRVSPLVQHIILIQPVLRRAPPSHQRATCDGSRGCRPAGVVFIPPFRVEISAAALFVASASVRPVMGGPSID